MVVHITDMVIGSLLELSIVGQAVEGSANAEKNKVITKLDFRTSWVGRPKNGDSNQ